MFTIGLTGGIGTGKSEVSRILRELGAVIIDADRVGHQAYEPRTEAWRDVVASFGDGVLQPGGEIDRKKLGALAFSDPDALARLNAIMHPRMERMMAEQLDELRRRGVEVAVVEAALLIEAGWESLVDEVWVVSAPNALVIQRLENRNHLPAEEIRRRMGSQLPFSERARHARVVVDNSGGLAKLRHRVEELWSTRVKEEGRIA